MHWTCHHSGGSKFLRRNSESMSLLIDVLLAIKRCYQNLSLRYQVHFSVWITWLSSTSWGGTICVPSSRTTRHCIIYKIALKYLKNNLRRPFENCEFTPLLYRITLNLLYNKFLLFESSSAWTRYRGIWSFSSKKNNDTNVNSWIKPCFKIISFHIQKQMTPNIVVYCHLQWIYSASQASECTLTTKCVLWLRHFVYYVFVLQKQIRTNSHTELMCKWYLRAYSCRLKYSLSYLRNFHTWHVQ